MKRIVFVVIIAALFLLSSCKTIQKWMEPSLKQKDFSVENFEKFEKDGNTLYCLEVTHFKDETPILFDSLFIDNKRFKAVVKEKTSEKIAIEVLEVWEKENKAEDLKVRPIENQHNTKVNIISPKEEIASFLRDKAVISYYIKGNKKYLELTENQ